MKADDGGPATREFQPADPWFIDADLGLEDGVASLLVLFNGSSGEGFQVVNQRGHRLGRCLLRHTMAEIEDERPIARRPQTIRSRLARPGSPWSASKATGSRLPCRHKAGSRRSVAAAQATGHGRVEADALHRHLLGEGRIRRPDPARKADDRHVGMPRAQRRRRSGASARCTSGAARVRAGPRPSCRTAAAPRHRPRPGHRE